MGTTRNDFIFMKSPFVRWIVSPHTKQNPCITLIRACEKNISVNEKREWCKLQKFLYHYQTAAGRVTMPGLITAWQSFGSLLS
ncbi:hypothetical protein SCFA_640030 [anaerobic digester metagenome]|uniref:Uncharacterized protein n=1 Tax=anaerobic digester metagenome TaxID=1263854 RepID=A0A485M3U6_9ZZZZ